MGFFQKKLKGIRRRKGDDDEGNPSSNKSFLSQLSKFPRPLIGILILCSSLSLASLVGCRFLKVNIGFIPANVNIESSTLDVGIFSVCDGGSCSYYPDPYHALGFNKKFGRYYQMYDNIKVGGNGSSNFKVPGDPKWTGVKVMGIMSVLLYFIATILALLMEFTKIGITAEIICNVIFASALCECVKCGCFFFVEMCVSNVWIDNTHIRTEGSYLKAAESCKFNQSSIMSTFTIVISTLTLCIVNMNKKPPQNRSSDEGNDDTILQYESDEEEVCQPKHKQNWRFSVVGVSTAIFRRFSQVSQVSHCSKESDDEDLTNLLVTTSQYINENDQTPTDKITNDEELGCDEPQQHAAKNKNEALYTQSTIINQHRRHPSEGSDSKNNAGSDDSYSTNSSSSEADDNSYENCTSAASTQVIDNHAKYHHPKSSSQRSDNYNPHRQQQYQENPGQTPIHTDYHHRDDDDDDNDDPPEYQEDFRDTNDYLHSRDSPAYKIRDEPYRQDEVEFDQNPDTQGKISPNSPFSQRSQNRYPPKSNGYSSDSS